MDSRMVLNRKDLSKAFSTPRKLRKLGNQSLVMNNSKMKKADVSNVNVYVRVRPPNEKEMCDNFRTVVKVMDEKLLVFDPQEEQEPFFFRGTRQKVRDIAKKQNKQLEFLFDGVFGPDTCNWDIHRKTTNNIIATLLEGYNCSVFVYGATGAGKTFTMLGKREHSPGIMYHTMSDLYRQLESISQEKECQVGVSFVEVYNENVFDLLHPSGPLHLREDSNGVTIVGLKVENISNADQLLEKLAQGNNNRTQHPTDANAESSRSHAVFQVYVRMVTLSDGQVKLAKLSMIDLAGSERGMATGCKGMRFKEGSNINKSLLALGNCISSLADGLRHIPYRDSKLTRLLKDSLGGNCQTVMIANISPSSLSYEDTYNTLKFASRARKITTKLTKNILSSDMHINHYMKLVDKLETENTLLKSKVRALEMIATDSARAYLKTPDISVWCNHLDTLYDEKIRLCQRFLIVKSEAHLLEWRIKYKNSVRDIIKNSSQTPGFLTALGRIEMSVRKFEGRLNELKSCMGDLDSQIKNNVDKLVKLCNEMEEARVIQHMRKDFDIKNALLRNTIQEISNKHLMRLLSLQQRRAETCEAALKMWEPILKDYHKMLSGLNRITNDRATEYENAITVMEGLKTVSWCDNDAEEIDSVTANALSAADLSFDESLFLTYDQGAMNLEPTVLPIMDIKDDEITESNQIDNGTDNDEKNGDETEVRDDTEMPQTDTSNKPECNDEPLVMNVADENEEDTANSTITLETPSIPLPTLTELDDAPILSLLPPMETTRQINPSAVPKSLNETVTLGFSSASNNTSLRDKKNEAKKNRSATNLPFSMKKSNFGSVQRNDKENMFVKNISRKNVLSEKFKDIKLRKPVTKTPVLHRFQQTEGKPNLTRPPLKPISAQSVASISNITPQVPSAKPLKNTHPKNRIRSHPYIRSVNNKKIVDK